MIRKFSFIIKIRNLYKITFYKYNKKVFSFSLQAQLAQQQQAFEESMRKRDEEQSLRSQQQQQTFQVALMQSMATVNAQLLKGLLSGDQEKEN